MNARTARAGLLFIALLFSIIAVSHPASDDFSKAKLLTGYVRRIALPPHGIATVRIEQYPPPDERSVNL